MDQQVIDFLKDTSKTSLEICSQFNMTVVDTMALMERLKRDGRVWQSKRRTMARLMMRRLSFEITDDEYRILEEASRLTKTMKEQVLWMWENHPDFKILERLYADEFIQMHWEYFDEKKRMSHCSYWMSPIGARIMRKYSLEKVK